MEDFSKHVSWTANKKVSIIHACCEKGGVKIDIVHDKSSPGDHVLNMRLITTSGTINVTIGYTVPYQKAAQQGIILRVSCLGLIAYLSHACHMLVNL